MSCQYGMHRIVAGIGYPAAAVVSFQRAASSRAPNRSTRGGRQDNRRRAIAPGKLDLTSRAKGTESGLMCRFVWRVGGIPLVKTLDATGKTTVMRLARRARYSESCSPRSTEACRSNPEDDLVMCLCIAQIW